MTAWHGGKGSARRPTATSKQEAELRDRLWRTKDAQEKQQIKNELERLVDDKNKEGAAFRKL